MRPQDLIERILDAATFDDCIVVVEQTSQANLRWASSTLTTNGVIAERKVTVIAFQQRGEGMATSSVTRADVAADEIAGLVSELSVSVAEAAPATDAAPLARNVAMGDWAAEHPATGPDAFRVVAPDLGEMFQRSVADGIELFGYAEHTHRTTWVGSKGGLRLRHDQPAGRVEMTGKSHNRSRSTWFGVPTRDFSNVSVAAIDAHIRQRLEWQARRVDLAPGHYDTVLPAGAVSDLLTYMLWMSAARDAQEGRSPFSKKGGGTRVGEQFTTQPLRLYSDPAYPGLEHGGFVTATASGPMASVFDNGQALGVTDWFRDGTLTSLVQTRASAALTGLPYTPMGDNLVLDIAGGSGTEADLTAGLADGLLLTTLWYIRLVDPASLLLTGLTRDGVYQVSGGEVVGAVNNFRWNESPLSVLGRVEKAGATQIAQPREWADYVDRVAMPPVIVREFNMSTVSQAN